jgi:hypothetical protein
MNLKLCSCHTTLYTTILMVAVKVMYSCRDFVTPSEKGKQTFRQFRQTVKFETLNK